MHPRIVITGLGVVSPAGIGSGAFFEALTSGRSLVADLHAPWAQAPFAHGAAVRDTGARGRIAASKLRRMGRLSQMAVVAALEALEQSGPADPDTGVVMGTGFGALEETVTFIGELLAEGAGAANPALFPASVMNVAAAHISMELGLPGYNTTVNHKEISSEMALLVAADALRLGHVGRLLVGGVDELSAPLHHGYRRLGALTQGQARPYGLGRDGVCLGEGAAVVALELRERALARGAAVLCEVAGIGAAGGPRPLVGWGPASEAGRTIGPSVAAGVAAVEAALDDAGAPGGPGSRMCSSAIDLVIGCGCGSPELDRLDADVIGAALQGRGVLVTSPHGALGTFPAAGAVRLASAVETLRRGCVYPTIADGEVDPEAVPGVLVKEILRREVREVMLLSHASGGGSAAIVLQRGES